jgi:predicted alpha/beta superfamily hydrolase
VHSAIEDINHARLHRVGRFEQVLAFLLEMIAITTRLRNDRNAPEMIIVAIENTDRNRDMMPVVAKDLPGPPRAEAFLSFLEKELVPEIEKAYRTAEPRILQGKSLSGLFTIYALLARPTVFNAYVRVQRWLVHGKQRLLLGAEHSGVSNSEVVC